MTKKRIALLSVVVLVGGFAALLVFTPPPDAPPPPPPPPPAQPKKPLQADAEGHYVPGYAFSVSRYRFTGFTLRPDAYATFVNASGEQPVYCQEAVITATTFHLRCDDPQVGVVTIKGKFRTRLATDKLDTPEASAIVTIRTGSGEILYNAQDSFTWEPARQ